MDFGLARPLREEGEVAEIPDRAPAADDLTSTTQGAVVGTPAYMAPEQLRGHPADTRTDQFSFCVALHEAIYGARPGSATNSAGRRAARVPAWLKRVIRRGLDPDPRKRFDSMDALLRAIEHGRNRLRRRLVLLAAGALVLVAAVAGGRAARARQFACTPPQERLEAVWPARETAGVRRAAIHHLFSSSGIADAENVWNRLAGLLDERVHRWATMYQDACEATHTRGEQSAEVLDLRMTCLADSLDETRAYTDGLLGSDRGAIARALATANALTPIERCTDVKSLRLQSPLPADPAQRAQVERLQQRLNDAEVLEGLLYSRKAEQQIEGVVPAARALGYAPLLAEALERLGATQARMEKFAAARESLEEALFVSEAARDDLTAAKAADLLAGVATDTTAYDEARRWLRFAEAALERIHARESLVGAWVLNEWGSLHYDQADFASSERETRAAVALKASLLGPDHPDVASSMSNLAVTLQELDRWEEALAVARQGLAIDEKSADLHSITFAVNLTVAAEVLAHVGRLDEAEATLRHALEVAKDAGGGETVIFSVALTDLGDLLASHGRAHDAISLFERAQAIQMKIGDKNPIRVAALRAGLARALIESREKVSVASQLLPVACATFEQSHYFRRQRELLAWFNALPGRAKVPVATSCADLARWSRRPISSPTSTRASAG
jgi:eukaryotic-like serine/threonine-protein kinase